MATTPGPAGMREPEAGTHRPFEDAIAAADTLTPARPDQQQDMTGGWRRRPLLGAMAGLVTSTSLIAGVGGGGMSSHVIVLAGVAGLAAGALSVATGQYVAVSSYNELVRERARKQALELLFHPDAEEKELAEVFRSRGFAAGLADTVARQVSADPLQALAVHVREQFGVDQHQLSSPVPATAASMAAFAAGALIPLLPYLLGYASLAAALALAAVAAFTGGGLAARQSGQPFLRGALRHMLLGAVAVGATYLVGHLAGTTI